MGRRAGHGLRASEDKLEPIHPFAPLFCKSDHGDLQSLMVAALLLPATPPTHLCFGQLK